MHDHSVDSASHAVEWTQDASTPEPVGLDEVLNKRGSRYGPFDGHAEITQRLKEVMREHVGGEAWKDLQPFHQEALDMIQHKVGRILNGDPNYDDSWVDIAGYAQLVVKILRGEPL